jgi:hypothetical protein
VSSAIQSQRIAQENVLSPKSMRGNDARERCGVNCYLPDISEKSQILRHVLQIAIWRPISTTWSLGRLK